MLTKKEAKDIGLSYVLENINVKTPFGYDHKQKLDFYRRSNAKELIDELLLTDRVKRVLDQKTDTLDKLEFEFIKIKDVRKSLIRTRDEAVLNDVEIFEIKNFILICHEIVNLMEDFPMIKHEVVKTEYLEKLLDPEETGLNTFYVYSAYSKKLRNIRSSKKDIEEKIRLTKDTDLRKELLDERQKLVKKEEEEEFKIRTNLSSEISENADALLRNCVSIGKIDFLISKASLAKDGNTCLPILSEEGHILMKKAYSPHFKNILMTKGKRFSARDIELKQGSTVITGANMGGKSVTLKTMVLNEALVHLGLLPFAQEMETPVFDFIDFVSEDMENFQKGLSSFGAEVVKLRNIMNKSRNMRGLIVLDEPARGTNPVEGRAIVGGLINYFSNTDDFLLVSTHYDIKNTPKAVHYQVKGLKGVDFDALKYRISANEKEAIEVLSAIMDYSLERVDDDTLVPNDAVKISELLGFDKEIINEIKKLL